jgi:4-carboxymuconolactone decarboxylase
MGWQKQEIRTGDVVASAGREALARRDGNRPADADRPDEQQPDGKRVVWMEKVSNAQYSAPVRSSDPGTQPRPSQGAIGDFSPKLAEITDKVLYGDIWERPQLSKRDRSLVTVAALIAMNRPDQLRSHLARARVNGVTQEELIETITHMAFYAGWPNAVSAIGVAREVFREEMSHKGQIAGKIVGYRGKFYEQEATKVLHRPLADRSHPY